MVQSTGVPGKDLTQVWVSVSVWNSTNSCCYGHTVVPCTGNDVVDSFRKVRQKKLGLL